MGNPNVKTQTTAKQLWDGTPTAAIAGPAGPTSLFSYTVPNFRKATVENLFLMIERYAASTVAALAKIEVTYSGYNDSLFQNKAIFLLPHRSNIAFSNVSFQLAQPFKLYAGDVLALSYTDLNADGSAIYHWLIKILEEDA